jgi:O-antigen ligase
VISPGLALRRARGSSPEEKRVRRVWVIWALLFFNVISYAKMATVVPIPHKIGQVLTQGALGLAFVLALTLNPKIRIRPNLFLALYSVLAIVSLAMSVRFIGIGTTYRALRLIGFLVVLWLLTPWWGRRDFALLRSQLRFLVLILATTVLGLVLAPHKALALNFGAKRLSDAVWPIPATQVAHYMAELTGLSILLWMCGILSRRRALMLIVPGFVALIATHTRTALVGMVVGLVVASLSLFTSSRRVRRVLATVGIIVVVVVLPLTPLITGWLIRGQTSAQVTDLSGRTVVWSLVVSEPRPETNKIFGSGLSNGSLIDQSPAVNGLPIDSSWLATYQDQGLVGIVLEGVMFLVLLVAALLRPRGPARAMALYLIVYCFFASFTETGMGEASTYLLDLTVAASLLVVPGNGVRSLVPPRLSMRLERPAPPA